MKPNIGLSEASRKGVIEILNKLLADQYVLYTKLRKFHWNVTGLQFSELHAFFESQYEAINGFVDDTAERVRQLGAYPLATLAEFTAAARLEEKAGKGGGPKEMIQELLGDHEAMARQLREDIGACEEKHDDVGTADFLTGLVQEHEKMAWMLRAFVDESSR